LQKRLELKHAVRGISAFSALLLLPFFLSIVLVLAAFAGGTAGLYVKTLLGSSFASFILMPLAGIAAAMIGCAIFFWVSLGVALAGGFIFNGFPVWVMQVVWPRTRGAPPLLYLAFAIVVATVLASLVVAPLEIFG
jgi:hypothetical protein